MPKTELTKEDKKLIVQALAELYSSNAEKLEHAIKCGELPVITALFGKQERIDNLLIRWKP